MDYSLDVASKHMTDMTSSFKAKTEKFVKDIQSDLKHQSKPILKHPQDKQHHQDTDDSQAYREEKRMSQYGKKLNNNNLLNKKILF